MIVGGSEVTILDETDTPLYGTIYLRKGDQKKLKSAFGLFNLLNNETAAQEFNYKSSNMSVATVEMNTGQMAAVKEGVSYINVTEAAYTHKETYIKVVVLPEKVPAGTTFRPDAVTKARHSVAVKYDGTLWAWGINNSGQLGTGNTDNCDEPVNVTPSGVKFKAVAAGGMHSLALDSEGNVWFTH